MNLIPDSPVTAAIRAVLLELARTQDDLAADELAATPYWSTPPTTAQGHRDAAAALREAAELLLVGGARRQEVPSASVAT